MDVPDVFTQAFHRKEQQAISDMGGLGLRSFWMGVSGGPGAT